MGKKKQPFTLSRPGRQHPRLYLLVHPKIVIMIGWQVHPLHGQECPPVESTPMNKEHRSSLVTQHKNDDPYQNIGQAYISAREVCDSAVTSPI